VINATKRTDFKIWRLVTRRTRRRGQRSRAPNGGDEKLTFVIDDMMTKMINKMDFKMKVTNNKNTTSTSLLESILIVR
jgi:hypothetical protein